MATIFPANPTVGQQYQGYEWNGVSWNIIGIDLTTDYVTQAEFDAYSVDSTNVHGIVNTATLATQTYATNAANTAQSNAQSYADTAISNLIAAAPAALNTLDELAAALNDDANFATTVTNSLANKLDISTASSTYLTQANASSNYAALSGAAFTGRVDLQEIREDVVSGTISSNILTYDYAVGNIVHINTAPTQNFTINFINVPTDNGKLMSLSTFVVQGTTGYIPNAVQIGGSAQTIKWSGGSAPTPTSSTGKIDIFTFTLLRLSSAWTVIGTSTLNI